MINYTNLFIILLDLFENYNTYFLYKFSSKILYIGNFEVLKHTLQI